MRRRSAAHSDLITRVNVTPIIDVALVLVTILLVTAPMLTAADLPVNLPQARTREADDERNVSITRTVGGELAVDRQHVVWADLRPTLQSVLARAGNQDVLVVVRADSGVPYGEIRALLAEARAAGAQRLAVATRQRIEAQP